MTSHYIAPTPSFGFGLRILLAFRIEPPKVSSLTTGLGSWLRIINGSGVIVVRAFVSAGTTGMVVIKPMRVALVDHLVPLAAITGHVGIGTCCR